MIVPSFNVGPKGSLPSTKSEGSIYITKDTGQMFVDVSNDNRVEISPRTLQLTIQAPLTRETRHAVSVPGVTADTTVIVSPDPSSANEYTRAGLLCTDQSDGQLTFTSSKPLEVPVVVNIILIG